MINAIREHAPRFVAPLLASIAASVLVGFGATFLTIWMMTERMDARVQILETKVIGGQLLERTGQIEAQINRHEKTLDRDFSRHEQNVAAISAKTDDHEKRLTRLETLCTETQAMLSEIRTDVKILLRGGQQ